MLQKILKVPGIFKKILDNVITDYGLVIIKKLV
jgi:hypothetical protein